MGSSSALVLPFIVWLTTVVLLQVWCVPDEEIDALVSLYNSTDGANWNNCNNWLDDDPCDSTRWHGVFCNLGDHTNVNTLDLPSNNLNGTLPTELCSLTLVTALQLDLNTLSGTLPSEIGCLLGLTLLSFQENALEGTIPETFMSLTQMKSFGGDRNSLSGTISTLFGGMADLTSLFLGNNFLTGSIPTELGGLLKLQKLDFGTNSLDSTIPTEFASLPELVHLFLLDNSLTGIIPPGLANASSSLKFLELNFNSLVGSIPEDFGQGSSLEYIFMNHNQLTGTIPSSICTSPKLTRLYMGDNSLTGTIPSELGSCKKLGIFGVSLNSLEGTIPDELWGTDLHFVDVSGNQLTGTLSNVMCNSPLHQLHINTNSLTGTLPSCLGNLSLVSLSAGGNSQDGEVDWLGDIPELKTLLLGNSNFSGLVGNWICGLQTIDMENTDIECPKTCSCNPCFEYCINDDLPQTKALTSLYQSLGGPSWSSKKNWLVPPPCLGNSDGDCAPVWEGVSCECEDYSSGNEKFRVTGLSLSDHNVTGSIPSDFINLQYVNSFDFADNSLTGKIPFTNLIQLPYLELFDVSNNTCTGFVDDWVCSLEEFDLRNNQFSCPLPSCCSRDGNGTGVGLCEPCFSNSFFTLKRILFLSGGFVVLLLCLAGIYMLLRRKDRRFMVVEEDDELVGLLKSPPSGPVEDPHPNLFWWRDGRGQSTTVDVSDLYVPLCQELLDSQQLAELEVVKVSHHQNPSLWRLYAVVQSTIKARLPRYTHNNIGLNDASRLVLEPINYKNYRKWMVERLDLDVEGREALLFHGAKPENVEVILSQGFDARVQSLDEGDYGAGCYFTEDVRQALQGMEADDEGVMYLFLARVCLGSPHFTDKPMKSVRRGPLGRRSGVVYDSVIGKNTSTRSKREFVVYDKQQCYPELLVELRTKK